MAGALHNPTFKRPRATLPPRLRSPSPPRAWVEPLSPTKPAPLEPSFNYPPLNDHIDFTVRPEQAYVSNSRARAYSANHKVAHHRTPSTIDTLAEAALALTPAHSDYPYHTTKPFPANARNPPQSEQQPYGTNEPPHKRARSELLPSPFIEQYASRPATSYVPANAGYALPQNGHGYSSRMEEAALLLNFQSGGWPNNSPTRPSIPSAPVPRPHANSFPQASNQPRFDVEASHHPSTLLPAFSPQVNYYHSSNAYLFQRNFDAVPPVPHFPPIAEQGNCDVEMRDIHQDFHTDTMYPRFPSKQVGEDRTEATAHRTEAQAGELPSAQKGRRGWPKGKPRGTGARKTVAEKAAAKRASSRKKVAEPRPRKSKTAAVPPKLLETHDTRRKSLSDVRVFGEFEPTSHDSQIPPRSKSVPRETPMLVRNPPPPKSIHRKADVKSDTICAGCETSRAATTSRGELDEWISCNGCKKWFHIDCAGFKKAHEIRDVDKFFCIVCESEHGKSTYVRKSSRAHASVDYAELQRGVLKTSEESMEHHYIQPIKDGSFTFDDETFPRMRPEMVTREFFERSGTFVEPICIPADWNPRPWKAGSKGDDDGLTMEVPIVADDMADVQLHEFEYDSVEDLGQDKLEMVIPQNLTVRQVCNLVGGDWAIDVIDVKTQNSGAKWTLNKWADYYEDIGDEKAIRNVISLEVSQTKLGRLLQRPKLVRDIDLQDDVWPQEEIEKGKFPKVQFYCLMSVADSYTDFHIDFGGSSVYYHIIKGKKTFFFIPPKPKHLKAYEEWNDSPQQNYTFLPSITKECYRVDLHEGDTMLIPSGWIHAVWTPEDSLVIGGNFLNRMSYKNQFKVVEIEKANETPMKFRYPFFQKIMWYTAIKYMQDDPMPEQVSQLFYEGEMFQRDVHIWGDFHGEIAKNDSRPGASNARFYSQAEVEGLPDLVNFIFRTVMLVLGRVEGTTVDRIRRVNASIPKGYGEPLELAKTFALWVAWKRGNEHPPAWAHPDAVLPNSKEEGPPKKLSERKLKEMERKEAIAAYRVAPDRQSMRVMTKNAKDAAASVASSPNAANGMPDTPQYDMSYSTPLQNHHLPAPYHVEQSSGPMHSSAIVPPMTFVMSTIPASHLKTPKTSVLGPKRVACDACRKRRIRCKHKEEALPQVPRHIPYLNGINPPFKTESAPDLYDNITITTPIQREHGSFMDTVMDSQSTAAYMERHAEREGVENGTYPANDFEQHHETNGDISPEVQVALDSSALLGDAQKRSRSKACYECRKSKRRCIHDENGNVDPIKATENPVSRNISSRKRPLPEDGSPLLAVKKQRSSDSHQEFLHSPTAQATRMQGQGVLRPDHAIYKSPRKLQPATQIQGYAQTPSAQSYHEHRPPIDPNLYSMYNQPQPNYDFHAAQYPYVANEHGEALPSLEQIANEVLVDLNGNEYADQGYDAQATNDDHSPPNGPPKTDDSVDSAVSLPSTEVLEQRTASSMLSNGHSPAGDHVLDSGLASAWADAQTTHAHQPGEINGDLARAGHFLPLEDVEQTETDKITFDQSSPTMTNGTNHAKHALSPVQPTSAKRKRESTSDSAKAMKKLKVQGNGEVGSVGPPTEDDLQSLELAKMLQQEDLGLRRRSK